MATKKKTVESVDEEKELKEKVLSKTVNVYTKLTDAETKKMNTYANGYKAFLDAGKTERECVSYGVELLEKNGFKPYVFGTKVSAGEKYYYNNRGKSLAAFVIGKDSLANGVHLAAAHVDSPRIDLKQHPVYEANGLGYLKTHYYGGIKKYQWPTIPLALHGVVVKENGEVVNIKVGDKPGDPVFYITDLLPHLAGDQMAQNAARVIQGEQLNILIGSEPYNKKEGTGVKLKALELLYKEYGITEDDFVSAELSIVPAANAVDIGFDRSLIGAYGHDDRVCAYPCLTAILEAKNPTRTTMIVLADKEEIGSESNSGMQCAIYFDIIADMAQGLGISEAVVRMNSKCLSADVNAAYDPTFPGPFEARNSCYINNGVVVTKFTGSRGKSGSNDANAEFVGYVRKVFNDAKVVWQTSELGRVDAGGGGTVAMYIARKNLDVIDLGVPVLSMHAPIEVISKPDLYMTHKAIVAFFKAK